MKLNSDNYWQAMGIPVWKLRDTSSQAVSNFQSFLLFSSEGESRAIVLAEVHSAEEQNLLGNIAQALSAQLKTIPRESIVNYSTLGCIIFGKDLAVHLPSVFQNPPLVVCDLRAMIQDPSLKKEVWQKIRILKKS